MRCFDASCHGPRPRGGCSLGTYLRGKALCSKAMPPFESPVLDDGASAPGAHARSITVLALAPANVWLVGAFHDAMRPRNAKAGANLSSVTGDAAYPTAHDRRRRGAKSPARPRNKRQEPLGSLRRGCAKSAAAVKARKPLPRKGFVRRVRPSASSVTVDLALLPGARQRPYTRRRSQHRRCFPSGSVSSRAPD
jgi:hypothetical protein